MARLNTRPLIAGAVIGAVAAVAILLLPHSALESIINRTHLGDVWGVAQPPFGTKARVLLALVPFVLLTAAGLAIGVVLGRRRTADEDYGSYPIYDLGAPPSNDPFASAAAAYQPEPAPVPMPVAPEPPAPVETPVEAPPAAAAMEQAQPVVTAAAPLDSATAADLAEIADAIVRLDARVDAIEARLSTAATGTSIGVVPAGLAERLQKIARALDDAG